MDPTPTHFAVLLRISAFMAMVNHWPPAGWLCLWKDIRNHMTVLSASRPPGSAGAGRGLRASGAPRTTGRTTRLVTGPWQADPKQA